MRLLAIFAAAIAMLFAISVQAAPPVDGGTLTLITPAPYTLGDTIQFEFTVSGHVNECPDGGTNKCARIQLMCEQNDVIVYAEAKPAVHPTNFVLGGASSPWLNNGGGPADCEATLYYWDFHPYQTLIPLDTVLFEVD